MALGTPEHSLFTADRSLLECGFHDARFRLDDGLCVAGPCLGHALTRFPVALADGEVRAA